MYDKRISIFTGHFGSGKTEVAVNFTLNLKKKYDKVAIADLDIVNPYFRTADAKAKLEEHGIRVITPLYANTNVDVPALPGEINSIFANKEYKAVFDAGGDDIGAKALSRYRKDILDDDYGMFFVVNIKRPMTGTGDEIEEMLRSIEKSSGLRVSGLVNNTNLLTGTTSEIILEGQEILDSVSSKLGIPVSFVSGFEENIACLRGKAGIAGTLSMHKFIKLPWD